MPLLKNTLQQLKRLNLDANIVDVLENVLLCRTELLEEDDQAVVISSLLQLSLDKLILVTSSDKKRLFQIFVAALTVFTPPAGVLHAVLFKPIIGIIPIETVIATI